MLLYLMQGHGVFGSDAPENLPCEVRVVPAGNECEVKLDGVPCEVRDGCFALPEGMREGHHALKVNGRACEGVFVKRGAARPAGDDFRRLLPAISRLYELAERVSKLEEKAREKEIDWLK